MNKFSSILCSVLLIVPALLAAPSKDDKDKDDVNRIENSGKVLGEILDVPDDVPQDLLSKARCVVVRCPRS